MACLNAPPASLRGQVARRTAVLGAAAATTALLLLLAAIASVGLGEAPGTAELLVAQWMRELRSPLLDVLAGAITRTGNPLALLAVAAVCGILLLLAGRKREAGAMAAGFAGAALSVATLKWLLPRTRPETALQLALLPHAAFPSAHAASSLVVYGFGAYLLLRHGRTPLARRLPPAACLALVLLIGLSRLYLNVHWLGDVLGGYALGGFWLALLVTSVELLRGRSPGAAAGERAFATRAARLLIPALILFLVLYATACEAR